ncbi:MAG: hypothetical protein EHM72_14050 [Calditrichaeota bacterium]|nr:MAG: hypothetical protein EHM72_14050 [Calditrichota bacterium]
MRNFIVLICLLMGLILGCSSTEGQGSGGIEPGSSSPDIIEGFMCGGVYNDLPVGIDNDFFVDDIVYIWLSWVNVTGSHEIKILWIDPNEKIIEVLRTFESKTGKLANYFWLDTTSAAPVGKWVAEVYLDGDFVRSYAFWLNSRN